MKRNFEEYIGKKYWHSTVIGNDFANKSSKWMFLCDCGNIFYEYSGNVIPGYVRSCGCAKKARFKAKSYGNDDFYHTWKGMMQRCYNDKNTNFKRYGALGISVCDDWHDAGTFIKWAKDTIGQKSCDMSLDRIDNAKGYSPENCKWSTRTEQTRNRRNTVFWTINGIKKPLGEWCDIYKMDYNVANARHKKMGWDEETALKTPVNSTNHLKRKNV